MLLSYTHTHDSIFKGVKQESSHLAKRLTDTQGDSRFEDLVFDEAYLILFRTLFFDARVNITSACAAYLKHVNSISHFDIEDSHIESNFSIELDMSDDFMVAMNTSIDIKMREYLISYIMYRWLETKSPEAVVYFNRSEKLLTEIRRYLEMRKTPRRIKNNSPW